MRKKIFYSIVLTLLVGSFFPFSNMASGEATGTYCTEEDGTQRCEYEATNCKTVIVIVRQELN